MNLDMLLVVTLAIAVFKGYQKGLLMALVSSLGIMVGVLVAFKFTTVVITQPWMEPYRDTPWLSFIVFAILVSLTIMVVSLVARLVQKGMELAMMGWINRLGGILFYCLLDVFILSCFVMLAEKINPAWQQSLQQSRSYAWVAPVAPAVIAAAGEVWPWIQSAVDDLEQSFPQMPAGPAGKPA